MKQLYVNITKPIQIKEFNLHDAPMGWYRIDILKRKLKENKEFRNKFTKKEINKINKKVVKNV